VNILLYADDIVLLLQSKEGLQNSLDILHDFFYTLKLKVNTDKSKIMVFNSNDKTYLNQFTYNNVNLETVANYCYLGMVQKFNGNFNLAINTLMEKARKAYPKFLNETSKSISTPLAHIFNISIKTGKLPDKFNM
jgi:small nuclear ribonucleoprotein (snRNP)-like protein